MPNVPMDPVSVGTRVADDWLEGTDENSLEELVAAIHRLAQRLGQSADVVYGDHAVSALATALREAADDMEVEFAERCLRGEKLMAKVRRAA